MWRYGWYRWTFLHESPESPCQGVEELCAILQEKQKTVETFREQYELSFIAHLNLVTIDAVQNFV